MGIQKNLVFGTLEVSPKQGRLWLKSQNVNLRINKLTFTNIEETFSMIDIQGGRAIMIPENDDEDRDLIEFFASVATFTRSEVENRSLSGQKKKEFLDSIVQVIREHVASQK